MLGRLRIKVASQTGEHMLYFVNLRVQCAMNISGQQSKIAGEEQVVLNLTCRPHAI
jgi:hypothetical protein